MTICPRCGENGLYCQCKPWMLTKSIGLLFDVPKDRPSAKQRLKDFCSSHGIETHHTPGMARDECPWIACHMPSARKAGYGMTEFSTLFDCIALVGRLLEETGVLTEGKTERAAVEELCRNLDMELPT